MKLLPLLISFTCLSSVHAWAIPWLKELNPLQSSGQPKFTNSLPRFLTVSPHPWLSEHSSQLSRLPNITESLCSLSSSLRPFNQSISHTYDLEPTINLTNSNLSEPLLMYPADLFHAIAINTNEAELGPGWDAAGHMINSLLSCPAALCDVQDLHFEVFESDERNPSRYYDAKMIAELMSELFAKVGTPGGCGRQRDEQDQGQRQQKGLRTLYWNTHRNSDHVFMNTLHESNTSLTHVTNLVLPKPGMDSFWVGLCPDLKAIEVGQRDCVQEAYNKTDVSLHRDFVDFLDSLSHLDRIDKLVINCDHVWKPSTLSAVLEVDSLKGLSSLGMGGMFDYPWHWPDWCLPEVRDSNWTNDDVIGQGDWCGFDPSEKIWQRPEYAHMTRDATLKPYLDVLSRFSNLTDLSLPDNTNLGLGFDGGAWCGNAYFGKEGRKYGRSISARHADATTFAGEKVVVALPRLERLCIGGDCVELEVDEGGAKKAVWPWTGEGRLNEWIWEEWPEDSTMDWMLT